MSMVPSKISGDSSKIQKYTYLDNETSFSSNKNIKGRIWQKKHFLADVNFRSVLKWLISVCINAPVEEKNHLPNISWIILVFPKHRISRNSPFRHYSKGIKVPRV